MDLRLSGFLCGSSLSRPFLSQAPCQGCNKVGHRVCDLTTPVREDYYWCCCYCYFMCMGSLPKRLSVYHVGGSLRALGSEDGAGSLGIEVWVLRIDPGSTETAAGPLNWRKS